nr:SusC/RagA family TonB-linked outer membrane protein [Muribaculaceae bacterium]
MKKLILSRIAILLMVLTLGAPASLAAIVTGQVTDQTGEPQIGVTVQLKGNPKIAVSTDFDGNYRIDVPNPKTDVLTFSFVGMKQRDEKVNGRSVVNVTLVEDQELLDEVVVVGYGQQKKASVVGAITQTTGETLQRAGGVSSVGMALTGNLPGVITESSTGMPGNEDPKIVIRGASSWNSSDPLVLVDGVERPMSAVDISSVETISVLKDASATAVYGVKGANGVILITTKRGQEGRAKISVGFNATAKVVSKLPGTLESAPALELTNRAIERELGLKPDSWSAVYPNQVIEKFRNPVGLEEYERYPNVDWQEELFKKWAMAYNPNISLSGGTKDVKYFAVVDFLHEGDLFKTFDNHRGYTTGWSYNRVNVRSNLDFKITRTTDFKVNLFGSHGQRNKPWGAADGDWGTAQLWKAAYASAPDAFLPHYSDGSWGYYAPDAQSSPNSMQQLAISGAEKVTTTNINCDFTLSQDLSFITPGLRATAMVAWDNAFTEGGRGINDLYHGSQTKYINPITGEVTYSQKGDSKTSFDFVEGILWSAQAGSVQDWGTRRNLYYQAQLFWARKFDNKHDVSAMAVFNRTENTTGSEFTHFREDWAFRVTYNFMDRYFFEYNGAYNGSEKFGQKNRFAFFNSGAIGWMITGEKFMNWSRSFLDLLKVRYSYGEVGDDWGDRWMYVTQWKYGGQTKLNPTLGENSPYTWYYEDAVGNPNVHWEKSTKQNLGIDYSFWTHFAAGSIE